MIPRIATRFGTAPPRQWSWISVSSRTVRNSSSSSSSSPTTTNAAPVERVAIVGGGPAGFYAASRLLSLPGSERVRVDLFELLPTPFGLARFGVAPDHPEVKNCEHKFEETARDPRFRYFGNVQVCGGGVGGGGGTTNSSSRLVPNLAPSSLAVQLPLSLLRSHYSAVLLTYGASLDRPLDVPGELTLSNVVSARTFVNWYNGHPHHSSLLSPLVDLSKLRHVTIIGQGNVALDVARILLKPVDELKEYDVPEYALDQLARSEVERVEIVGRRGVLQLAATTKELREMVNLNRVGFDGIDETTMHEAEELVSKMGSQGRAKKRALDLLKKASRTTKPRQAEKSWSLDFLKSPKQLLPAVDTLSGSESTVSDKVSFDSLTTPPQRVGAILYDLNELVPPSSSSSSHDHDPSRFTARPTGQTQRVETDLVFKSVGYRSIGIPGLPFDEQRGVVRNVDGRVVNEQGETIKGLYTSGWLARGPNGVIATTMFNAFATADLIASDLASSSSPSGNNAAGRTTQRDVDSMIESARGNKRLITWQDWETIDRVEKDRGKARGKLREKITSVEEMLQVVS